MQRSVSHMTRSVMYADNSDPSASIDSTCNAVYHAGRGRLRRWAGCRRRTPWRHAPKTSPQRSPPARWPGQRSRWSRRSTTRRRRGGRLAAWPCTGGPLGTALALALGTVLGEGCSDVCTVLSSGRCTVRCCRGTTTRCSLTCRRGGDALPAQRRAPTHAAPCGWCRRSSTRPPT